MEEGTGYEIVGMERYSEMTADDSFYIALKAR